MFKLTTSMRYCVDNIVKAGHFQNGVTRKAEQAPRGIKKHLMQENALHVTGFFDSVKEIELRDEPLKVWDDHAKHCDHNQRLQLPIHCLKQEVLRLL